MRNNTSFIRKIVYLVLMAALLVPLYLISAPSFIGPEGGLSEGGKLTQLRDEYGLAQSNLGEIDPASESMKLATLGMRGVAANILWERANEYKKREEWDNLRATLNQIAKLQPNFISVWQFQAWNLSYNVSVEFDNYEHRYHWVKKGIEFLMQGIRYNRNEPRLLWDLGWFFGHKLGRSDEYIQFRREYSKDNDFHDQLSSDIDVEAARDYKDDPDNWLTAHQWFSKAQRVVDLDGVPIKGKNPLVFHSDSAKALIRYADAIETGGGGIQPVFGEVARLAWEIAYDRWLKYGDRDIPTSYGYKIRLNEGDKWNDLVKEREAELEALSPGLKDKLTTQRLASLTAEEKRLLAADRASLDPEQYDIAVSAQQKATIEPKDIVAGIKDAEKRREAKLLTNRISDAKAYATTIRRYQDIVNFKYWRTRCEVEQEDRAIEGRQFLHEAQELYAEADLIGALEKYDQAWKRWATIHADHEILAEDVTAEDLVDQIKQYRTLLTQLDLDFPPEDFPMLRLVANYANDLGISNDEASQMLIRAAAMEEKARQDIEGGAAVSIPDKVTDTAKAEVEMDGSDATQETVENSGESDESAVDAESPADTNQEETTAELTPTGNVQSDSKPESDSASGTAVANSIFSAETFAALERADSLYRDADLQGAKASYEEAWKGLTVVSGNEAQAKELVQQIRNYRVLLGQLDEAFPPQDFPLLDFVKENGADFGYSSEEAADLK